MVRRPPGELRVLLVSGVDRACTGNEATFMRSIWHKAVTSMSGGFALPWCPPPSNVLFLFIFNNNNNIQVSRSNTSFASAFKPGELGGGPHPLCMNYKGVRTSNYDSLK